MISYLLVYRMSILYCGRIHTAVKPLSRTLVANKIVHQSDVVRVVFAPTVACHSRWPTYKANKAMNRKDLWH